MMGLSDRRVAVAAAAVDLMTMTEAITLGEALPRLLTNPLKLLQVTTKIPTLSVSSCMML